MIKLVYNMAILKHIIIMIYDGREIKAVQCDLAYSGKKHTHKRQMKSHMRGIVILQDI